MNTTKNILCFIYSLGCYAVGVASLIYFIFFIDDMFIGNTVNAAAEINSLPGAIFTNLVLLSMFGLQHSLMARATFKHWLTRVIHPSIERSTYILGTALVMWSGSLSRI